MKRGAAWPCRLVAALLGLGFTAAGHAGGTQAAPAPAACLGCHAELARGKQVHAPVAAGVCEACHRPTAGPHPQAGKATFQLAAPPTELCATCHPRLDTQPVVHLPVKAGACTFCHDPHRSDHKFRLRQSPDGKLCAICHGDKGAGKEVHGPVAVGACVACHDPHQGSERFRLVRQGNDLCFGCHLEKQEEMQAAPFVHAPAKADCGQCHDPHTAPNPKRTRKPLPDLCFGCHAALGEHIAKARTKHDALSLDRKCANCHDPHAAPLPRQLKKPPLDLCLGCHDRELQTPTGKIMNMKAWLEANEVRHGPVRQGDCAACHDPHGSDNFRILRRPFPRAFYAAFREETYALCFACHERGLVLDQKTTSLTGFRNGDLNLHFRHVNQAEKGRTCRACHEIHASQKPKHIREGVPFGAWEVPIQYERTATGGRCAPGCHPPRAYDRVDMGANPR